MAEVAEEGEADRVGRRAVDRVGRASRRPSVRSRTRSGRISVFWWPTALWLVSGATTVTSPIGSSACLSASSPRDSTPSSLVTRILRPGRPVAERPGVRAQRPRAAARARRRRAARRAPCRGRAARSGPARGSCPAGRSRASAVRSSSLTAVAWRVGSRGRRSAVRSSSGVGARRCRSRCRGSARAGCGPAARRAPRAGAPPGRRPVRSPEVRCRKWRRKADTTAAIGIPKIAPGMPAIRPPMSTEPRTTIGWMPTAPCMIRGWSTFMTTSQPTPIRMIAGSDRRRAGGPGRR